MTEDTQLHIKQELLKTEIIEKNYDKDKFLTFCLSKKENGDDLTKWTLLELNDAIIQFIKIEKGENLSNNNKNEKLSQQLDSIQNINITHNEKPINNSLNYEKEITCKKLEKTPLNDKEIKVIIQNPKASDSKFYEQPYITYEVITETLNFIVRRRFSDFDWLRSILQKNFPRLLIPPLPNKKLGNRRFEPDFIEKRMKFLQIFIDNVMLSETFKANEGLFAFLSFTDRNQFESKMKEISSFQPSPYCEDMKTLTGKLNVCDIPENEKYYVNINNYFRLQNELYGRLNYNLKNYYVNTIAACKNLEQVQKDFETLHLLNNRVLMKQEITKSFEILGIFFKNWKRILENQNEIIKIKIKDFFKYQKMENVAYSELIYSREILKNKYVSENTKLMNKKEKLYSTMDISKWEIIEDFNNSIDKNLLLKDKNYALAKMCTRETQNVENYRKQFGYSNKMNMEELKRIINLNVQRFTQNIKSFSEEFYPTLTDAINVWTCLTSYL